MASSEGMDPSDIAPRRELLHAPWRLEYLESMSDEKGLPASGEASSFLEACWRDAQADVANHVIVRTGVGMIMLNRYPYANGHLLVCLGEARPTLMDYEPAQRADLWKLVELATDLMQRTLEPQGVNIGINQGRAAGAGVPQHLHVHLVPRWGGDVNFMEVVGQIRVIPSSLEAMAERYRREWSRIADA